MMAKHILEDSTELQSFYVTGASWSATPANFTHPNDTLHLGARKVTTTFINNELQLKPKTLSKQDAFGDFRITGNLAKTGTRVKFYITAIELILRKELDASP
ncbi:MAG: hypothetical protein ACKOEO_10875 [Planctomycetaceae bacterium]